MNLQTDIFARAKSTADSAENKANIVLWKIEAGSNLTPVFVQPLCSDVQFHALRARVWESHCCFKAEEGLILHADCVVAFHNDLGCRVRITVNDALVPNEIAVRMNWWRGRKNCKFGVDQWGHHFVLNNDCCKCSSACFRMICSHCGNRFAHVSNYIFREHRLVAGNQAICQFSGYVFGCDYRVHSSDEKSLGRID